MATLGLEQLGEFLAHSSADPASVRKAEVEAQIRQSIACLGFGGLSEIEVVPRYARAGLKWPSEDWLGTQSQGFALGTLGAASDLDPLDPGPAHLALPGTVAALLAARRIDVDDRAIEDALLHGMEVAARLRAAASKSRPGVGFHSGGTFGLFSAAATVARLLKLDSAKATEALAISFTRAAGLAVNSAQTAIGLTHFGCAVQHGLESALLAADGWTASHDMDAIYGTLFGVGYQAISPPNNSLLVTSRNPAYKAFPCNIYINLAVLAMQRLGTSKGPLTVLMPMIRHLDNPSPRDVRELRNSVQGSVAVAQLYGPSYRSFTQAVIDLKHDRELRDAINAVKVEMDPSLPTSLVSGAVTVRTEAGAVTCSLGDLRAWDDAHLAMLIEGEPIARSWMNTVMHGSYLAGLSAVTTSIEEVIK